MNPSSVRLGIVPFLNVVPLLEGLGSTFPQSGWVRAVPSRLRALLEEGVVDVATLPTFEALRLAGSRILPGAAIACDGAVRSVQVLGHVPAQEARRVLLDGNSRTSVHLAQVIFRDLLEHEPEWVAAIRPIGRDEDPRDFGCDAAVVIGDLCLDWEHRFPHALDLGEAWRRLTGLPFVFAAWVARAGATLTRAEESAFVAARERGESSVAEIARRESSQQGRSVEDIEDYLGRAIRYGLGAREIEAITEFRRRLIANGLLAPDAQGAALPRPSVIRPATATH